MALRVNWPQVFALGRLALHLHRGADRRFLVARANLGGHGVEMGPCFLGGDGLAYAVGVLDDDTALREEFESLGAYGLVGMADELTVSARVFDAFAWLEGVGGSAFLLGPLKVGLYGFADGEGELFIFFWNGKSAGGPRRPFA